MTALTDCVDFYFIHFAYSFRFSMIYGAHISRLPVIFRQERFICRVVDALSDPRVTHEIRSIWVSYWSQVSSHVFSFVY